MASRGRNLLIGIHFFWIAVIFILCFIPGDRLPQTGMDIPHLDKLVHFGMFYILSLTTVFPLDRYTGLSIGRIYALALTTAIIYGGLIEILQQEVFSRSGDILDLAADAAGSALACISYTRLKRFFIRLF